MKYLALICLVFSSALTLFAGTGVAPAADNPLPPTGRVLSARAMYRKALQYEAAVPPNYTKAMYWFRKAVTTGNAHSLSCIGYLYQAGLGVRQDPAKAIKWFREAAASGDVESRSGAVV